MGKRNKGIPTEGPFTKKELKTLRASNPHVELVDDKEALARFNREREEQERALRGRVADE